MRLDRDAILDALLERCRGSVDGLRHCSRRLDDFMSIPKPALTIVTQGEERDELGMWTIDVEIGLDVEIRESNKSPETVIRSLIGSVDAALDSQPGELVGPGGRTNLGLPNVESVSINGRIEMVQGINGIGSASVPVRIVAYEPGAQD